MPILNANVTAINLTASQAITVSGKVTDANGAGVSGVYINTDYNSGNPSTPTDTSGNYALSLPPGSYTVNPWAWNYNFTPSTARVVVGTSPVNGINFTAAQNYTVSEQVLNGTTGVPGATVQLCVAAPGVGVGNLEATTITDTHGNFYFNHVPASNYMVVPTLSGYGIQPVTLYIQLPDAHNEPLHGNDPGLTFYVTAGGSVSGTVTDASGLGLAGIPLNIQGGPAAPTAEALFTDNNGCFIKFLTVWEAMVVLPMVLLPLAIRSSLAGYQSKNEPLPEK